MCACGKDVGATPCELCSQHGGALKPTTAGRWVHVLCASWIPEVYCTNGIAMEPFNLEKLDKKRFQLRCGLCRQRGACVQCCFGRCSQAAHPICALRDKAGWSHRITRDEELGAVWEMFCHTHATSVRDPVKPRAKKAQALADEDAGEEFVVVSKPRAPRSSKPVEDGNRVVTVSACAEQLVDAVASASLALADEMSKGRRAARDSATVYTMSEWPGQSEGEAMDLEHFWHAVSMMFPEDRGAQWVGAVCGAALGAVRLSDRMCELTAVAGAEERAAAEAEGLPLQDRDRQAALDLDRRSELLFGLCRHMGVLDPALPQPPSCDDGGAKLLFPLVGLAEVMTRRELHGPALPSATDPLSVSVLLEGDVRRECSFALSVSEHGGSTSADSAPSAESRLLCPRSFLARAGEGSLQASLTLRSVRAQKGDADALLWDREVIARGKLDPLNCLLKTDLVHLARCSEVAQRVVRSLGELSIAPVATSKEQQRREWRALEELYRQQRIWKRVARLVALGMRDHTPDSSATSEAVPASWAIPVDGRPKAQESDPASDDSTCAVCFSGASYDDNSILFCDGCNSAMHQFCYGVSEIPEGSFFCDRCRAVQELADNFSVDFVAAAHGRDAITCCLCPRYHGGLKPTTDGRWVHLCCALWSQTAVIQDLEEMGPVDVSGVDAQPFRHRDPRRVRGEMVGVTEVSESLALAAPIDPIYYIPAAPVCDVCKICLVQGGFLVRCRGAGDEAAVQCDRVFHPICAWFEGLFLEASITDPSFQGSGRDGLFPSGLEYCFACVPHTPPSSLTVRRQQLLFRLKFKLDERDLDYVPGQHKRKKKRPVAVRAPPVERKTSVLVAKELKPDVYDPSICAACITPIPEYQLPSQRSDPAFVPSRVLKCMQCGICVHATCVEEAPEVWTCPPCAQGESDPRCFICPRRGGLFGKTTEDSWIHDFCGRNMPCSRRCSQGQVEIRAIPKEYRKQKCVVCNRKSGVSLRCSHLGCAVYFHALCAERSAKVYIRHQYGVTNSYCGDHIPEGVQRVNEGYWIDFFEFQQLNANLDKARIIMDTVRRRDKLKKALYKSEGELHLLQFNKLLDRAMGRKTAGSPNRELFSMLGADDDEDLLADEDPDLIPVERRRTKGALGALVSADDPTKAGFVSIGDMLISTTWFEEDSLNVPRRLTVKISGIPFTRSDSFQVKAKDYKATGIAKIMKDMENGFKYNQYVTKSGDLANLHKTLGQEVQETLALDFKTFVKQMAAKDIKVKMPSKRSSKIKRVVEERDGAAGEEDSVAHRAAALAAESLVSLQAHPVAAEETIFSPFSEIAASILLLPEGFENVFRADEADASEWVRSTDGSLVSLERRMQYVLDEVAEAEVVRKKFTKAVKVAEKFQHIPYDSIPNYNSLVRTPICLDLIRSKLQQHLYRSLAAFAGDFYEMLSNSRIITDDNSQVAIL